MVVVTNSVGSLFLGGKRGCLMVGNHDEDMIRRNLTARKGGNNDGKNDAVKVFNEMSSIKMLEQDGSVREYYVVFVSLANRVGWDNLCSVTMFTHGLQPEIAKMVRILKPKTLYDAYCLAIMQESTNELLRKIGLDVNFMGLDVNHCLGNKGNKMVTNKEKHVVLQYIRKKEDRDSGISVNNSEINIVNESGEREIKRELGNGIEGDEVIEFIVGDIIWEEEEDCTIEEIESNGVTAITGGGIGGGELCKENGKGNQIELSEVIGECCKENVNGKEIVSIGLTTHDTNNDEKNNEKSDGKHNEMRDGKSDEVVHFDGKREDLELLDENGEGFELLENHSLDFVKLVEAVCDDKLDEVIVGGYGTHLGAIRGVEEFIKNNVKKNGSEVLEIECSVVDESEVKNSVKNGREFLEMECSVVDVKKEEGFEELYLLLEKEEKVYGWIYENGRKGKRHVGYIAKLRTVTGSLIFGDGQKGRKKGIGVEMFLEVQIA
ncbi:hypothetical protein Tco_1079577 [Tanacetum coccineum]|uniref:Uncharacterized protein n=1 Tax=Tanacetum coccineum TaxID=301880 RepID=A0ABQ5HTY9_9ASTR